MDMEDVLRVLELFPVADGDEVKCLVREEMAE